MHGGRENEFDPEEFDEDQKQRAKQKQSDTLEQRAREAGL